MTPLTSTHPVISLI